jgi:hypothetical protein
MDDSYIALLSVDGRSLPWATFLGGSGDEMLRALALDVSGNLVVIGSSESADFPATPGAYDSTLYGSRDAFVAKLWLVSAPNATVTSPTGGEVWIQGSSHTVTWTATDDEDIPSSLLIWINYTSSAGSGTVCGPVAGNVGTCGWTLPYFTATDVVINGTVIDTDGLRGYGESGPFTIQAPPNTPPTIAITNPIGGEVFHWGSSLTVSWTSSDAEDPPAALTFWINYTSSAGNGVICGPLMGVSSCSWPLSAISATDVVVNGTIIDTGGAKGYDESEHFTIQPPPNTPPVAAIYSPETGMTWTQGSSHSVIFSASDNEDPPYDLRVWINYTSSAGGGNICGLLSGGFHECAWTLPAISATDVVVNITVIDLGGLKGYNETGAFTIKASTLSDRPSDFVANYWWLFVVLPVAVSFIILLLLLTRRRKPEEKQFPPSGQRNSPPRR